MEISIYEVIYIIMNLFRTYVIYKYMCIFHNRESVNKRWEFISYTGFYLLITVLYLLVHIPIIMLISNLVGFFLLSYNYKTNLKQRFLSTVLICIILLCVESIVTLLTGYINFPVFSENYYSSVLGIVSIQTLSYVIVLILQNYKKIKCGKIVTLSNWIRIFTIPIASLYVIVTLFYVTGLSIVQLLICIVFLFMINIMTFSFYDKTIAVLENKMENQMLLQQNNYYEKQFELMKTSITTTRAIRHDIVNHLYIMQILLNKNETNTLKDYLLELQETLDRRKEYVNSGNLIIDSILNFKLQEAEQKNILTQVELNVPEKLIITSFDMTVILGNLVDNAMNAVCKLDENKRKIDIQIRFSKNILIIRVNNQYDGIVHRKGDKIITSNVDKINHGIGLRNVKNTLEKYHGKLEVEYTKEEFNIIAVLYTKSEDE